MTEDLDFNLDDNEEEIINRKDKKINSISQKLELSEKEKVELAKQKEDEAIARQNAEKERDFFKGFNSLSSKYEGASEYQEQIWEKVKAGYDMEDAAVAVLNKEGKFTPNQPEVRQPIAAGGSASIGINSMGDKKPAEMNRSELKSALQDLESKGDFSF